VAGGKMKVWLERLEAGKRTVCVYFEPPNDEGEWSLSANHTYLPYGVFDIKLKPGEVVVAEIVLPKKGRLKSGNKKVARRQ
jgi:hypothetical protein